ncbi:uncharacterized protein LOC124457101 [Xenia sp. Carnegie-2017]|uniref:uncharacterized protein LOC124457101 n=1 Tax=Xenia sp. Carnegie-2017 TaxID=2897299 RepID=UPI001F04DBBC|nr:uncharacterized protein LOC124457101 [Xenia sp. Carnegie-2017]
MANCHSCNAQVAFRDKFCSQCGIKLCCEVVAIKYYFKQGYKYDTITEFLAKFQDVHICVRTFKNRLKTLGLSRKFREYNEWEVRERIMRELSGPGCMSGYWGMWHILSREGFMIPRQKVQEMLKELDPEGCETRRAHRLRRRVYVNPGPNFCWHLDGYDKLKPFGFFIHGCIDGFSRKMLWLHLTKSNNNPQAILKLFLNLVMSCHGCPKKLRTDLGTENGLVAAAQCYFTNDDQSHVYGTSQHNQRIEGWWSYFRRSRANWWINFFKDLMNQEVVSTGNELEMECLWFCFSSLFQQDLNHVKDHWNTHYIRRSRFDTVPGRPNKLYYLPERHNSEDFLQPVSQYQCDQVLQTNYLDENKSEYEEYFVHVMDQAGLELPLDWRQALDLYNELIYIAKAIDFIPA